ncbi:MAG TPA: EVE domain-containing protein [Steroidobacteraceae bacterium]|nr:EVE domain-containing protein [Steroidobacteraceae bacterium]
MNHWLMKTEPTTFGVDDLARAPKKTTMWDGVRNYQARNMLRDDFAKGDRALLYHSSCAVPGVVGVMRVTRAGYPDPSAFDRNDSHYDAGSDAANPRWYAVDVQLERRLARVITLEELRRHATRKLAGMILLQRGSRLSVMPLTKAHYEFILSLE